MSFQGSQRTVIDYAICSHSLFPSVHSFKFEPRIGDHDHAAIVVQLEVVSSLLSFNALQPSRKRKREEITLPDETELDKLLIQTLAAGKDEKRKLLRLYGPLHVDTPPLKIVVHGACQRAGKHTATAGSGIYFGINSPKNYSLRVWANQTNVHADLAALLWAIKSSPLRMTLEISTRSEYAIRSVVYYAAKNENCGWKCPNGDIPKLIFQWIKVRVAPIHFIHIKKLSNNGHLKKAQTLAITGCNSLRTTVPSALEPPIYPQNADIISLLDIDKVSCDLPHDPIQPDAENQLIPSPLPSSALR